MLPHIYFGWTEGNPVEYSLRFLGREMFPSSPTKSFAKLNPIQSVVPIFMSVDNMKVNENATTMKTLTSLPRWLIWGITLPLFVLNGWVLLLLFNYFKPIVTLLVIALLLTFILSYPVKFLQRFNICRSQAVVLVLLLSVSILILLGVTLIPTLIGQINELANRLPAWIDSGSQQLQALQAWVEARHLPIDLSRLVTQLEARLSTQLQALSGTVLNIFLDAISSFLNLLLTIVLTFYLLLHGERLWNGIFQWFPSQLGTQIRQAFRQNFQNYFIGQATLALLMGIAMTIAFVLIQVPFGLLFGLGVGFLALFPFGASLGIALVSLLTALNSFWLGLKVLIVAIIIDQLIENGIAPQLIGGFTGLNPVWILLSLLVGAKIAGLLGLIIAVPFASSLKSLGDRPHPSPFLSLSSEPVDKNKTPFPPHSS
jgi:predicted PurR-regulated permease PerM